jgi:hypothetical protein
MIKQDLFGGGSPSPQPSLGPLTVVRVRRYSSSDIDSSTPAASYLAPFTASTTRRSDAFPDDPISAASLPLAALVAFGYYVRLLYKFSSAHCYIQSVKKS